jgi:hypothetical protein
MHVTFLVLPSFGNFARFQKFRQVLAVSGWPKLKSKMGKMFRQSQNSFTRNISVVYLGPKGMSVKPKNQKELLKAVSVCSKH